MENIKYKVGNSLKIKGYDLHRKGEILWIN